MRKIIRPAEATWQELTIRSLETYEYLERAVKPILRAVKRSGDKALKRYVYKYDKVRLTDFLVSEEELREAQSFVSDDLKRAIQAAKYNIAQFHITQKEAVKKIETTEGVHCWQRSVAITKVGLYIPSGHAPQFSTILTLGIPANIAGCEEIILCSKPESNGKLHPYILYTAFLLNIRKIYKVGGVQAIAAMAYGTESIPKVDKIFGPSNEYVTAAKQLVGKSEVAIDLPSGPSELIVFADETCNPVFVAADLIANSEERENSQTILVTTSESLVDTIIEEVKKQMSQSNRLETVKQSLDNAKAIVFENNIEALRFINQYAPENLILAVANEDAVGEKVINAGAVFLGNYSAESAGNYAAGPNHTLPTNGYAKVFGGVSVDSFVKKINYHKFTEKGIKNLGPKVELIAEAEQLLGRKNAVSVRLQALEKK